MKAIRKKAIICIILAITLGFITLSACSSSTKSAENEDYRIRTLVKNKIDDANYYLAVGDYDKARDIFFELLEWDLTGEIDLPDEMVGELYLSIGYTYEIENEQKKALGYYTIALDLYMDLNFIEESFTTSYLISRIYYYLLDYDNTLKYLELCYSFYESHLDKTNLYNIVVMTSKIYFYTNSIDKAIDYLENIIANDTFVYNNKVYLNLQLLLSTYYLRKGDYDKFNSIDIEIDKKCEETNIDKTNLDYYLFIDVYKNINNGNYSLAHGLLLITVSTDEIYFEILRIKRLMEQEEIYYMPVSSDYFKNYPYLYAGLFLIETGYIEANEVNLHSGINRLNQAIDFFNNKNDRYHLAEAYFAKGKVYYLNKQYADAIHNLVIANDLYIEIDLSFEKAVTSKLIGESLYRKDNPDYDNALSYLKDSSILFEKFENHTELSEIFETMAYIYGTLSETELQIINLKKAINSYEEIGNNQKANELRALLENLYEQ